MKNVALITGASSGIGEALATEHAKNSGDLILVARRKDKLDEIKERLEKQFGITAMVYEADLTNRDSIREMYDYLQNENIVVEYLINNAGFGGYGMFYERKWSTDQAMIDLNVYALTYITHLFLKKMIDRNKGRILNVASTAAFMPGPLQATYFATKAYVKSLSYALTEELKGTGVRVTTLCPGPTRTEFEIRSNMRGTKLFAKAQTAEYVARLGYRAMLKGQRKVITDRQQAFLIKLIPFVPMSIILNITRKLQEK